MKAFLFVLLSIFTFGSCASVLNNGVRKDAEIQNVLDDFIMAIINNFKDVIVNGNECLGLPPLDPLRIPSFPLNITSPLVKMNGVIGNIESTGLKSLETTSLSCNLLTLAVNLVMEMPSFYVGGLYDVNGLAALIFPIYGEGPFSLLIGGMKISGAGALGARLNGSLYMKSLDFTIEIDKLEIKFEGLLGGGDLGDTLNQIINTMGLAVYNTVREILHDTLMDSLLPFINAQLKDILLADIIGGIIKPPPPSEGCELPQNNLRF